MNSLKKVAGGVPAAGRAVIAVTALIVLGWVVTEVIDAKEKQGQADLLRDTMSQVVQRCEEQVIDLPEDGGAWYTTLFLHADWRQRPQERQLAAWFASNPRLASLKAQTHWNVHTQKDRMYRARWAHVVSVWPCVLLQTSDGKVRYKASGDNIPSNADQLASDITTRLFPCPKPKPKPNPTPAPDTNPVIPDTTPDITPDAGPAGEDFPWALLIVGILVAVGAVLFYHFKKPGGLK